MELEALCFNIMLWFAYKELKMAVLSFSFLKFVQISPHWLGWCFTMSSFQGSALIDSCLRDWWHSKLPTTSPTEESADLGAPTGVLAVLK